MQPAKLGYGLFSHPKHSQTSSTSHGRYLYGTHAKEWDSEELIKVALESLYKSLPYLQSDYVTTIKGIVVPQDRVIEAIELLEEALK